MHKDIVRQLNALKRELDILKKYHDDQIKKTPDGIWCASNNALANHHHLKWMIEDVTPDGYRYKIIIDGKLPRPGGLYWLKYEVFKGLLWGPEPIVKEDLVSLGFGTIESFFFKKKTEEEFLDYARPLAYCKIFNPMEPKIEEKNDHV